MTDIITARIISKSDPVQDDIDTLRDAPTVIQGAGQKVYGRLGDEYLAELRTYPRKAVLPFGFATEKSKRWYMAAVNGRIPGVVIPTDGKRYKRTDGLADSIYFDGRDIENGFEFAAGSTWDKAAFVVGRKAQVPGHKTTGWPKLANTIENQFNQLDNEMQTELKDEYIVQRDKKNNK